jgi:cupin 2 domain-containing protein
MVTNLLASLPCPLPNEVTEILVQAAQVRIERIVSHGHHSPPDFWYDQDEHEFVLVVQGAARLQFDDEILQLKAGDWQLIPAHRRHRVAWTTPDQPTVWLAVFYRDDAGLVNTDR